MKRLLLALGLLFCAANAGAQTTTFNGVVKDLTNTPVPTGQVTFTLKPGIDTTISGSSRFVPATTFCEIHNPGVVSTSGTGTITVVVDTAQNWLAGDSLIFVGTADATLNASSVASPYVITVRNSSTSFVFTQSGAHVNGAGGTVGGLYKSGGTGACAVMQNTAITPQNTSYTVGIQAIFAQPSSFNTYAIGSGPVDISTVVPTPSQMPAYSFVDTFSTQSIAGWKTFTGPFTVNAPSSTSNTIALPNPGVFTNTQMNNYLYSLLGGCSLATEIQGNANATQAVAGCVPIPVGATINNAAGVAGFANTSCNSLARTVCNAVGGYFQGRTLQSLAAAWGGNFLVNDVLAGTNTGHHMIGVEVDVNVFGSPTFVRGISILMGGTGTIPANNGAALEIFAGSGGGTAKWSPAISIDRAATNNLGIVLDGLLGTNPTASQLISFSGYDGGGIARQSSIRGTQNGDLQLTPNAGASYFFLNNAAGVQIPGSTSGQAIIKTPAIAGTPTLTLPTATGTFLSTGSGAGNLIQTQRTASCTTGAGANAVCTTTVTWANPFADANYTAVCSLVNPNVAQSGVTHIAGAPVAASISVEISNFSTASAATGTLHCTAIHD